MSTRIRNRTRQRPKRLRTRKRGHHPPPGACTRCGCTEADCRQCIKAQGFACSWADELKTLCTRCA